MCFIFQAVLLFSLLRIGFSKNCVDGDTYGNSNFKKDTDLVDNLEQTVYLATSSAYTFNCCGLIKQFKVYGTTDGEIHLLVWRPKTDPNKYELVNNFKLDITGSPKGTSSMPSASSRPTVNVGDMIGWYSTGVSRVPYVNRTIDGYVAMLPVATYPEQDEILDWTSARKEKNRVYAIADVVIEATDPPDFKKMVASIEVGVTEEVNAVVYEINIGNQRMHDVAITLNQVPYFELDTEGRILVAKPLVIGSYTVVINVVALCGLSSTASITIEVIEGVPEKTTESPTDVPDSTTSSPNTPAITDKHTSINTPAETDKPEVTFTTAKTYTPINTPAETDKPEVTFTTAKTYTPPIYSGATNTSVSLNVTAGPGDEDDSDGWKIGVGISVSLALLAAIGVFAYNRWRWYRIKHNGRTSPDGNKADEHKSEEDDKDRLKTTEKV